MSVSVSVGMAADVGVSMDMEKIMCISRGVNMCVEAKVIMIIGMGVTLRGI